MNIKQLNEELVKLLEESEQTFDEVIQKFEKEEKFGQTYYYIPVHIYDIAWNVEPEDYDYEYTKRELKKLVKTIPTELDTVVELDDNDIEHIKETCTKTGNSFEKELDDWIGEILIDQVSDEMGYFHDGFNYDISI